MSTERIDHVKAAKQMLADVEGTATSLSGDDELRFVLVEAQVHATLALVEQQRIANVLAFAQFDHNLGEHGRLYTNLEGAAQWRTEAGKALGLS